MAERVLLDRINGLRRILDASNYTVALCGSGMMEEAGTMSIKKSDRAYEIETEYGASPEYIYSNAYYNTRPEQFFDFYKKEILKQPPPPTDSGTALAAMERAGKLQCIITGNIYNQEIRSGCERVINLHGTIYQNACHRCGKKYDVDYMLQSPKIPVCEQCKYPVRPGVFLFGELVDSQLMTRTTEEVEQADVLILLGTTLESEVFKNYIRYFQGSHIIIIHGRSHYTDHKADLVIVEEPKNVLPLLGY